MAKKAKAATRPGPQTIIDEHGYETDGMFKWGGPKVDYDFDKFAEWAEEWNKEYRIANAAIVGTSELLDVVALPLDASGLTMRIEDLDARWALGGIDPELFDVSEPVEATPKRKHAMVRLLEPFKSKTAAAARYRSGL